MTVILDSRWDINLDSAYRVAWRGENVRISDAAMDRISACRASFLELIDSDPSVVIYGVTTSMGELASQRLTKEERERHARLKPFPAATSFGDYLPERVVRGIVLARLTNFLEGHAATTPRIALAVRTPMFWTIVGSMRTVGPADCSSSYTGTKSMPIALLPGTWAIDDGPSIGSQ